MLIALDLETQGGGSFGELEKVWCCSYAYRDEAGDLVNDVLDFSHLEPQQIRGTPGGQTLQRWLDNDEPTFHNASFDVPILRSLGFDIGFFHCSMVMGYAVNPNILPVSAPGHKPEKYSLWAWGIRLGIPKLEQPDFDTWDEKLKVYAKQDTFLSLNLTEYLLRLLGKDAKAWQHYLNIERPYIEAVMEMEAVGMHIDEVKLLEVVDKLEDILIDLEKEMTDLVGLAPIGQKKKWVNRRPDLEGRREDGYLYLGEFPDPKKPERKLYHYAEWVPFKATAAGLSYALKELYDWQPKEFTKTGVPKTNKDILSDFDYPLVELYLENQEASKLLSTYGEAFLTRRDAYDFIHASWNQCITRTGRLSSSKPNLQNIPTRTDLGKLFRECVTAIPGWKLVGIDCQAIEYRVLAALQLQFFLEEYGEIPPDVQLMVDVFNKDPDTQEGDIHTQMALLWSVSRSQGKNISYGR